jgi:hypothetical protein
MSLGEKNTSSGVRSAESNRISSCSFADRVAELSISAFKRNCPSDLQDAYKQTVLAAFLIQRNDSGEEQNLVNDTYSVRNDVRGRLCSLEVVSFGVGTKVLPHQKVIDEFKSSLETGTKLIFEQIGMIPKMNRNDS